MRVEYNKTEYVWILQPKQKLLVVFFMLKDYLLLSYFSQVIREVDGVVSKEDKEDGVEITQEEVAKAGEIREDHKAITQVIFILILY